KIPETKVTLKQKVTYKNIFGGTPKVEYHVPNRKPSSFKQKSVFSFGGNKIAGTDKQPQSDLKIAFEKNISICGEKEQFPKYNSISMEKVLKPEHIKAKKAKVIEVSSADHKESDKKTSVWKKFTLWLSGLFGGKKKEIAEFKDPDKISGLDGFPKPKDSKIEVIEEKKIFDYKDQKIEYRSKLDEIDKKIGQPQQPKEKDTLISYATPVEVQEEINIIKEEPKKPIQPIYHPKEIRYDHKPEKQSNIVASNFLEEKTNIKTDIGSLKKDIQKQDKESKESWMKKLLNWLSGLFSKEKLPKDIKEVEEKKSEKPYIKEEKIEKKVDLPSAPKPQQDSIIPKENFQEIEENKHDKQPDKQKKIIASNFLEEKTNIKTDIGSLKKDLQINIGEAKESWIKKFINWVKGIFSKDKSEKVIKKVEEKKSEQPYIKEEKIDVPIAPKMHEEIITPKEHVQEIKEPVQDKKVDFMHPAPVVPLPPLVPPPPIYKTPLPPPAPEKPQLDESIQELPDKPKNDVLGEEKKGVEKISDKLSRPIGINGDQMNWEVNLIPEESKEKEIPISKILVLVMSVIIAVGVVFGGWLWANYYYNTISVTISEVDAEIANIQSQVAQYENIQDDAKELQQKIENVSLLLEKHIYWSEFFNKLEFYTLSKVYFNSMSADVNGTITLTAVSDTYENAIKQLYIFEDANDFVNSVTISNVSKSLTTKIIEEGDDNIDDQLSSEIEKVNFNVNLTINPALFYYIN
ncbi:MAG: hypothetical protein Q8P20_10195, partial [bacterium]|nr:hypothetical protein [bacterium]